MPLRTKSKTFPDIEIYWGFDKFENEELLKYFWENDIWFHVDKHSSAHTYVRLLNQYTFDDIPPELVMEAAQITKAYSIEGCKISNLTVIYTPAFNIHKDGSMDTGSVSFKNDKMIKRVIVPEKDKELLRFFKHQTIEDKTSDLRADKLDHEKQERHQQRHFQQIEEQIQKEENKRKKQLKEESNIKNVHRDEPVANNQADQQDEFW